MGVHEDSVNNVMRDFRVDGDPSSGQHHPSKKQVRQAFASLARATDGVAQSVVTAGQQAAIADGHRAAAAQHEAAAAVVRDQIAAALMAEGAKVFVGTPEDAILKTDPGDVFLLQTGPGTAIYTNDSGEPVFHGYLLDVRFDNVAAMLAFDGELLPGTLVRTIEEGFSFRVVSAWAAAWGPASAGGTKFFPFSQGGWITARMFGAVDGTDCTAAMQAAVNFAMYGGPGHQSLVGTRGALIDVSLAYHDDSLRIGYGDAFRTIEVEGLGAPYGTAASAGTTLIMTVPDRDGIVTNGGRGIKIGKLKLVGPCHDALDYDIGPHGTVEMFAPEFYDEKKWNLDVLSAGVTPRRRHGACAGLNVDPGGGDAPSPRAITGITGASPAVATTSGKHGFLSEGLGEAVEITGVAGLSDGTYYAQYVSDTEFAIYNLDWTPVAGGGLGAIGYVTQPGRPPVVYPQWYIDAGFDADPDAEKKRSSEGFFSDLEISGYEYGAILGGSTQGSNTDFMRFFNVDVSRCFIAFAVSHANHRNNTWDHCEVSKCWAVFTNNRTGDAIGAMLGKVVNLGGGFFINLVSLTSSSRMRMMTFEECQVENFGRFGEVYGSGSANTPTLFIQCEWKPQQEKCVPPAMLDARGGDGGSVKFLGGSIRAHHALSLTGRNVRMDDFSVARAEPMASEYLRLFYMATMGAVSLARATAPGIPSRSAVKISNGQAQVAAPVDHNDRRNSRDFTLSPYAVSGLHEDERDAQINVRWELPQIQNVIAASQRSAHAVDGRTVRFTHADRNAAQLRNEGVVNGSALIDDTTGTTMAIRSVDPASGEVVATLVTNWYEDEAGAVSLFDPDWNPAAGNWRVIAAGIYTPPIALYGDFTAGSNVITNVRTDGVYGDKPSFGLAVGDALAAITLPRRPFWLTDDTTITAIDTAADTITITDPSRASLPGQALNFFQRAAPPNQAEI